MDALVRRAWGRAIALVLTIALSTAAGISLAPEAQAAGTSITASDAVATTGDAVPTVTFTADYILTTAPTCAVYDTADTTFASPLTGTMAAVPMFRTARVPIRPLTRTSMALLR